MIDRRLFDDPRLASLRAHAGRIGRSRRAHLGIQNSELAFTDLTSTPISRITLHADHVRSMACRPTCADRWR